jgi:hypothetical protein
VFGLWGALVSPPRLTRLEDRLDALDGRLPRPAFEDHPELQWIKWATLYELDILEHVFRQMDPSLPAADLSQLPPDQGPLVSAIIAGAQSRQALGWPPYDAAPERYARVDEELNLGRRAYELKFGSSRE